MYNTLVHGHPEVPFAEGFSRESLLPRPVSLLVDVPRTVKKGLKPAGTSRNGRKGERKEEGYPPWYTLLVPLLVYTLGMYGSR